MSTDKPRIQAYIEPQLYEKLKRFQQERGLKESPALNQILAEYFGVEDSQPTTRIEDELKKQWDEFNLFRIELKNEVWLQLKKEFAIWNETLAKAASSIVDFNTRLEALEATVKPIEGLAELSRELPISEPFDKSPSELPKSLNGSELGRRLGVAKSVISRRKAQPNFYNWTKSKDPEAIAWRYDRKSLQFFPVCQ